MAQAPARATLVIFHSAVLCYVPIQTRASFVDLVRDLSGYWISNEAPGVVPGVAAEALAQADGPANFLLALDGRAVALTAPHGQGIRWLESKHRRPVG